MDTNYSEPDDEKQRQAHPQWALNSTFSEPDSTTLCQTPRVCQTRSTANLKKTSMNQHVFNDPPRKYPQQNWICLSLNLRMMMATSPHEAATIARIQLKGYWKTISPSHQNLRTQSVVEPDLPRTPDPALSTPAIGCDLPGPMSRDDDEDSSPFVFALDLAEHTRCSNYDMTTFGHE